MVTSARVLQDVTAPAPSGCSSPLVLSVLRDFFATKNASNASHYWLTYRAYAHYQKRERNAWPSALEALFKMDEEAAMRRIQAFRTWLRARSDSPNKGKQDFNRPCMYTLFKLARERGVVSWRYPKLSEMQIDKAWEGSCPKFRLDAQSWIQHLQHQNYRPQSIVCRSSHARKLGGWLSARGINHRKVDDEVAGEYVSWIIDNQLFKDTYKAAMIASARTFYRWMRFRRVVAENPFDGMGRMRTREDLPRVCSERDILRLIRAADTPLHRAVIEILYATGCRVSELCGIELANISFDARHIKILGKGRRERMVLFNEAATRAIKEFLPIRKAIQKKNLRRWEPALLLKPSGYRLQPVNVQDIIKVLARKSGVSDLITPHTIRHSFATHLLNHGADIFTLMHLLGHKSIQATIRYLRMATVRLLVVYQKCHPRK